MKASLSSNIRKMVMSLLLIAGLGMPAISYSQVLNDTINKYARVNSLGPDYVIINDLVQISQFAAGDTVLLIQMQGVGIVTDQDAYGQAVQSKFGEPGGYEFLLVQSVDIPSRTVTFTKFILNAYSAIGNVQLIRVPYYSMPVVNSTLHARPWSSSSGTGGVFAMIVGRKLILNADIDVSGAGFKGAPGSAGIGDCFVNDEANRLDSYPLSYNNAGLKGEGVAIHDWLGALLYPDHAKGQGINLTGGGGGNGKYSGGGGGSNRGLGGDGGPEKIIGGCGTDAQLGGLGGTSLRGTIIENGIFVGGGGGASTRAAGSTASPGGNGGGIIIIVADSIEGNNRFLRANGISAGNALLDAGAGGGGAGGSVVLSFQGLSNQLQATAAGGNGGINSAAFGGGGGGSGGLLWVRASSLPSALTGNVSYGTPGPAAPSQGNGEIKFNFGPRLNGFLFNSIWSAVTGTQTDSVCTDTPLLQITGTQPVGGTEPFTYLWESSTTSESAGFTAAAGVNNQQHYTPSGLITQTTWFRRRVTDSSIPAIEDISRPVRVIAQPYIKNNVIGDPDTVCFGQNSPQINPLMIVTDGNGVYEYRWEASTDNTVFTSTGGTDEAYLPPDGLTQTTWYRRVVISGRCTSVSDAVRINVLDNISGNSILTPAQEICDGMLFTDLEATTQSTTPALSGGDGVYRFLWESSPDGSSWSVASGINDNAGYNPDESGPAFPGEQYFRRTVYSGADNVCSIISAPVLLTGYPVITNNLITTADQTICSGSTPVQITATTPLNGQGPGSYTYTWQSRNKFHDWEDLPGYVNTTSENLTPAALTDTTLFRRIVYSSACSDISPPVSVNVHKPLINNISLISGPGPDTTICSGSLPNLINGLPPSGGTDLPGDYAFQWSSSPGNTNWTDISTTGTGRDYQPPVLTASTYYRRRAISGACTDESDAIRIIVLPQISNNTIASNQTVCMDDPPAILGQSSGITLSGGSGSYSYLWEESTDGFNWAPASGTNNASNGAYQPPPVTGPVKYRRRVFSGPENCCSSLSNEVDIEMDVLPPEFSINAGSDTTIFSFDYMIQLTADPPMQGASGIWSVIDGSGSFQNQSSNLTRVTDLSKGLNRFMWSVTLGACVRSDLVDVTVYDIFIPEGFSPNNDNINDVFKISGLDPLNQEADLVVVNGAGVEVFSTSNMNGGQWKDWEGRNSAGIDLPEGTYYYLLRLISKTNGQVFKKSGFVILKRY